MITDSCFKLSSIQKFISYILVSQKIEFNQVIFQILKVISELLRPEDRKSLLRVYTWPEQDDLTQHLKIYENDLLAVLVAKETSQTGRLVDLSEYLPAQVALE